MSAAMESTENCASLPICDIAVSSRYTLNSTCQTNLWANCMLAEPVITPGTRNRALTIRPSKLSTVVNLATCQLLFVCLGFNVAHAIEKDSIYISSIKPLLKEKCVACHGPVVQESDLRLDAIQFVRSLVPSKLANLESCDLLDRIKSQDLDQRMPPADAGTALNAEQIAILDSWLRDGLTGPKEEAYLEGPEEHWAYRPIERPAVLDSALSPIDQLVADAQSSSGLHQANLVDDSLWLRRVTHDLIGVPPTVQQLREYSADVSPDKRNRAVERLLASSSYGERWARHWMDVWRYSDWDGYKQELRGSQRHIWNWRDWIIESLNDNKSYDAMLNEMLAGDEISPQDQQLIRATGFLARNYHKSNRNIWLEATVEHVGKAFLGLTLNCAKCHDHKYDPVSQQAYYQFRAIFEPHHVRTDQVKGHLNISKAGIPRVYDSKPDAETFLFVRGDDRHPDKDLDIAPSVPDWLCKQHHFDINPVELPVESYYPALAPVAKANQLAFRKSAVNNAQKAALKAIDDLAQLAKTRSQATTTDEQHLKQRTAKDNVQLTALKLSVAIAELQSYESRFRAEEAKYFADRIDPQDSSVDPKPDFETLARQASIHEQEHMRLEQELELFTKRMELQNLMLQKNLAGVPATKEKDSAKKDSAKKIAGADVNDTHKKQLTELEKKLSAAKTEVEKAQTALNKHLAADHSKAVYKPLGEIHPKQSTGRRLALANWITDRNNPLTARVAVNHIWLRHFGKGLSASEFDFGLNSPTPELLPLLDWLAAEFIESGWDMKHLHRLIVLSDAYARKSSGIPEDELAENLKIDPDNALLWRGNVRRLDAEQVRDSMLAVAGAIDTTMGGPDIDFAKGEEIYRRSVYFRHAYEKQMSMLVLFDAASPTECYQRRPSIIPQQALVMANSKLARDMANRLSEQLWMNAETLKEDAMQRIDHYIDSLVWTTLNRSTTELELKTCQDFLQSQKDAKFGRRSLAMAMLNHNDFLSIR